MSGEKKGRWKEREMEGKEELIVAHIFWGYRAKDPKRSGLPQTSGTSWCASVPCMGIALLTRVCVEMLSLCVLPLV